jgi:hypothetical protein
LVDPLEACASQEVDPQEVCVSKEVDPQEFCTSQETVRHSSKALRSGNAAQSPPDKAGVAFAAPHYRRDNAPFPFSRQRERRLCRIASTSF